MVQEVINVGAFANDGTGDPLRTALLKTNNNFSQIFGNLNSSDVYQTNTAGANLTLAPGSANVVVANNAAIVANATNFTTMYANNATFNGQITTNTVYPIIGNLSGTASTATLATTALYATTAGLAVNAQNFSGNNLPNVVTIGNLISVNIGIANIQTLYSNSNVATTGNIATSAFILGNGYYLSGLSGITPSSYGNANVAAYMTVYSGNVLASNLNATGNVALRNGANLVLSTTGYVVTPVGSNGNINIDPDGTGDVVLSANTTLWLNDTTEASSIITGALVVKGGIGVAANIYSSGNIATIGNITTTGNTSANYGTFTGNLTVVNTAASGNITAANLQTTSNVTASYYYGNGSLLSGMYGNTQAAAYLLGNLTYGNAAIAGVAATGNVSATYFVGSGAALTGLYSNTQAGAYIGTYLPTYTGNLTAGNLVATGNVGGTYFIGNGSLLTGMYSNTIAASYLPTYSGNINAGNVNTTSNVYATYFVGSSQYLTGLYSNASVALYLPTYYNTANIAANGVSSASYVLGYVTINGYTNANLANISGNNVTLYGNVSTLILDYTLGQTVAVANVYLPANADIGDGTKITIGSNITVSSLRIIANDSIIQGNISSITPTTPVSWHYLKYAPYNGNPTPGQLPGGPRWIRV